MNKKTKGYIAEAYVSARLIEDGWQVLNPIREDCQYDLVAEHKGKFIRIQIKYATPKDGVLNVNCRSSNNWSVLHYSPKDLDFIAVFNPKNKNIYYIPASKMNKSLFKIRIKDSKNNQKQKINLAKDFLKIE